MCIAKPHCFKLLVHFGTSRRLAGRIHGREQQRHS